MPQPGPGVVVGTSAPGMGSQRQMPPPGATPPPLDPFGALWITGMRLIFFLFSILLY